MKRANAIEDAEVEESRLIEESRKRRQQIKIKYASIPDEITKEFLETVETEIEEIKPTKTVIEDDMFADEGLVELETKHVSISVFLIMQ